MQRIRYGLTGLAFVFLMVLLGTAVIRSSEDPAGGPNGAPTTEQKSDPLAQLGVAPGEDSSNEAQPPPAPQGR